jgi:hypothetical protein
MKKKQRAGQYGPMPLKYFDNSLTGPSAPAGHDLLKAVGPLGVRPLIGPVDVRPATMCSRGGKRRKATRHRKTKGGFVPSVMGNFLEAASKYIVPVALFAGYKLMTRKKSKRRTHRHRR